MTHPDMHNADSMTGAQAATMIERMSHIVETMRQLQAGQLKQTEMLVNIATIQTEVKHADARITEVENVAHQVRRDKELIEKRIVSLEGWLKLMAWGAPFLLAFICWAVLTGVDSIRSFDAVVERVRGVESRMSGIDGRLTNTETVVQSKAIESTFDPPSPPAVTTPQRR